MGNQKPAKFSCADPIGHNKGVNRVAFAMPFEGRQEGKLDEWWGRVGRIHQKWRFHSSMILVQIG